MDISASFIEIYNERVFDLLAENPKDPIVAKGKLSNNSNIDLNNPMGKCVY